MHFRRLRVAGFKSFVEPAELLVEPGLTGLVGPNGCGKSNLLEAIRWVMGEGSARSLRGGGMDDVIFAGTARRPARSFAEVSLLVEQDGAEREVTRRIERGAGSAYRLDGRDVRARDVALLFADAATGAHSPALVSQGRVAAVIAAKPAERRQMLEEAAGIAGLHVRRREAEGKLAATEANLQRLGELLTQADARVATLRRQARAATRYRELTHEIRVAEARALFARWREAAAAAEQARAQAAAAEAGVSHAADAQAAAAVRLHEAGTAAAAARTAAGEAREAAAAYAREVDRLLAERTRVARRLADLRAQADALARDRAREDALTRDAGAALARLEAEADALAAALAEAEAALPAALAAVASAESMLAEADAAAAATQARLAGDEAELRIARAAQAAAGGQLARAAREAARAAREAAALPSEAPLRDRLAAAQARAAAAEAALAASQTAGVAAEAMREAAAAALDQAGTAGAAARAALAAAESERRALAAAPTGGGGDRLLDRLRVAPGYERALAAALGDDLDAPLADAGAPRGWAGSAVDPADPPLPPDAVSLATLVTGPSVLARRLAQVLVVGVDNGRALAAGQRLVTREGRMRRWDGFHATGGGGAAAERLIRRNRLAELDAGLPALRAAADAARAAEAAAQADGRAARAAAERARTEAGAAEQAARAARREEDALGTQIERLAAQGAALAERALRAAAELAEAEAAVAAADRAAALLPDPQARRAELGRARAEAETGRRALGAARAEVQAIGARLERDRRRAQAAAAEQAGWRARAADAAERAHGFDARGERLAAEQAALHGRPDALDRDLAAAQGAHAAAATGAAAAEAQAAAAAAAHAAAERAAAAAGEALAAAREARAGAAARADAGEARRAEVSALAGERFGCPAAVLGTRIGFDGQTLRPPAEEAALHERLLAERERLGAVNLVAEQELLAIEGERALSAAQADEVGQAVARLRGQIGELNREGRARLRAAFAGVDAHFRRLYARLFAGGEAHLRLIDADDPLEAGLEIMAQPPGKRLGSLTLLSGGEQALTAVALVFALFLTNPAPICVLDEVDAPLDDANTERFCDLLDAMTRDTDTRYLVVTHNPVTMARMHRLFGVTMVEPGISRLVSVDLGGAETLLAAE